MGSGGAAGGSAGGGAGGGRGVPGPSAGGAPSGPRGGIALDLRRGRTSKQRLEIAWRHPVWKPADAPEQQPAGGTVVVQRERALPLAEAYELVTGGDRRPLLVLRECERCKGTDHALLSRTLDNEQTVLLTHWFHCVKLPANVLEENHPLHALFARGSDKERIPHLFFADPDGGNRTPLPGDQSQADLWKVMFSFLDRCYDGNARKAVKDLRALLSQFDKVDALELEVKARIDKEIEKRGPDSDKLERYEADLKKLQDERVKLFAREQKLRELALKDLQAGPADGGR